jgi:hypothetical protein
MGVGEHEARMRRATIRHTAVGYVIHHCSSVFWAALHEWAFGRKGKRVPRMCLDAALTSAGAYFVDYYIAPKRLRPGFRKHLSPGAILASYAAFAAGLAAVAVARGAFDERAAPHR